MWVRNAGRGQLRGSPDVSSARVAETGGSISKMATSLTSVLLGISPSPPGASPFRALVSHSMAASHMEPESSKRPRWKLPVFLKVRCGTDIPSLLSYCTSHCSHRPAQIQGNGGKALFLVKRITCVYREERN